MEHYTAAAIFILTVAIMSAGIMVSVQLRSAYKTDFLSTLIFFQVFWFTFGFYVFWGKILIVLVLKGITESSILQIITNLTVYLGSPFLIFSGLMYLRFTREIAGRKFTGSFIAAYLIINILVFTIIAILSEKATIINRTSLIKHVFVLFYIVYTFTGLFYLLSGKKKRPALKKNDIRNLSAVLVIVVIIQSVLIILLYDKSIYFTLLFILIFYLLGIFLPFYLKYFADLSVYLIKEDVTATFDSFCESYEISKREKEIIYEICKGLSNQQIADKLFISLQTVKDHTHRIYFKTNCNSRTQLMRMVNANR